MTGECFKLVEYLDVSWPVQADIFSLFKMSFINHDEKSITLPHGLDHEMYLAKIKNIFAAPVRPIRPI